MEQQKASLRDILNYQPETYFSASEINLIKYHFKGNEKLIKLLRKVFFPSAVDPELPIEELNHDSWLMERDYAAIPNEEVKSIVLARQDALKFLQGGLIKLKVMANAKDETPEAKKERVKKDSNK